MLHDRTVRLSPPSPAVATRAATLPAQLLGLLLVLAPAVADPLPVTGSAGVLVRSLALVAGLAGAAIVFGGLLHRLARA